MVRAAAVPPGTACEQKYIKGNQLESHTDTKPPPTARSMPLM